MGREDFSLLTDDEILNALEVGARKAHARLWPKVLAQLPGATEADSEAFFERCKLSIAGKHGLLDLVATESAQ